MEARPSLIRMTCLTPKSDNSMSALMWHKEGQTEQTTNFGSMSDDFQTLMAWSSESLFCFFSRGNYLGWLSQWRHHTQGLAQGVWRPQKGGGISISLKPLQPIGSGWRKRAQPAPPRHSEHHSLRASKTKQSIIAMFEAH